MKAVVAAWAVERVRAFALWAQPEALAAAWSGKGYIWEGLTMNIPQDTDTAIELVASEAPESADSDLSDEALDRPAGWKFGGSIVSYRPRSIGR